jgi:hypothetical protein
MDISFGIRPHPKGPSLVVVDSFGRIYGGVSYPPWGDDGGACAAMAEKLRETVMEAYRAAVDDVDAGAEPRRFSISDSWPGRLTVVDQDGTPYGGVGYGGRLLNWMTGDSKRAEKLLRSVEFAYGAGRGDALEDAPEQGCSPAP